MAVLAIREILPRGYSHKLGDSPTATCVWSATLDQPTPSQDILDAIGITLKTPHPEFGSLTCTEYSLDETDRHHATVTYTYSIPDEEEDKQGDEDRPPWFQPDTWNFSTTNSSVACTEYYPADLPDNQVNMACPLVNTAGDAIFGQSKAESELKITISGSRLQLNIGAIKKYHNSINKTEWAGFPKHTVQCVGVSASPAKLEWKDQVINYWQINIELIYRSSTHNLFLPNVGWNVIVDGKKLRAWTYIEENGIREKVPTPHPVALNRAGGFLCGEGQDGAANYPVE